VTDLNPNPDLPAPAAPGFGALVVVTWTDASFDFDYDPTALSEPCIVRTAGWVVPGHTGSLHLAQEMLPGDGYRAVTHIPTSLIHAWTEVP
jgi:hypothetical protein